MKSQTGEEVNQCFRNVRSQPQATQLNEIQIFSFKIQFQITIETAEIVVSQAIDLWQEYGGPTGLVISESIKK